MIRLPILRFGRAYESAETLTLSHHATGEPVARIDQANSGLIVRDVQRVDADALAALSMDELLALCRAAAEEFTDGQLPCGDCEQTLDDYVRLTSATTGMPAGLCRRNAAKIAYMLREMRTVLAGLTRGLDLSILDRGHGLQDGRRVGFVRTARVFGAVLPSNSPGVHALWIPAIALKTPVVVKPGREEPWTPLRIIEALCAAGVPRAAFGYYPSDHGGAAELLRVVDQAMLFGDAATTRRWAEDPRVELHGPGHSKVLIGEDAADDWPAHLDVIVSSIAANAGRSCVNASAVWIPRHGRALAEALAGRLAQVRALPAEDPRAELAAFSNPAPAEAISGAIDAALREPGARELTAAVRGGSRLVRDGRIAWLLPTIVYCETADHPLAEREFLFPYASVLECPAAQMPSRLGPTLVATAISHDTGWIDALQRCRKIDRLNIGAIPTWQIAWDQPHEGNLFERLYRRRSVQLAEVGS